MSKTIEGIMRHTTPWATRTTDAKNGTEKLEKEFTVRKRHYIWSEARFVRSILPFHANVRVGHDGNEVDGKSVLDLLALGLLEGSKVRVRVEGHDAAKAMDAIDQLIQSRP